MSNKNNLKKIRDICPEWVKYILTPYLRYKFFKNKNFVNTYKSLIDRESETESKIHENHFHKLKEILIHCQESVPYYTRLFKQINFNAYDFKDIDDIKKIPFLTKDLIRENFNDLISAKKTAEGYYTGHTGGTTGESLKFILDYSSTFAENAFIYKQREKLGLDFKSKIVTFRGLEFKGKFCISIPYRNEYIFSPFTLNKVNLHKYINKINRIRPKYLKGYLSSIYLLARLMKEEQIKFKFDIKAIYFISENIDEEKRSFVELFFNSKSSTFYGLSERVVLGDEFSRGLYKFDPYYGHTELLEIDKTSYEIIGTGFLNKTMPLIRYKTGDICIPKTNGYQIIGRRENESLIGNCGEIISQAAYNFHNDAFKNILTQQLFQVKNGEVDLYISTNQNFDDVDVKNIKQVLKNKFKNTIVFNLYTIDRPILTKNGKFMIKLKSKPNAEKYTITKK